MSYDAKLWDESDPMYAPGLSWSKPTNARWKCPKRYAEAGYEPRSFPLPGHKGDGRDEERAAICRDQTRQMVRWYQAQHRSGPEAGTWGELFSRYEHDKYSPIHRVKITTKPHYLAQVAKLNAALGHMPISALTYEVGMEMKMAMEAKGRSVSYVTRLFKQFRAVAAYGRTLGLPDAARACDVLSGIKLTTPPSRSVYPTRDQVRMIVDQADAWGMQAFACGFLMCFEMNLRAVDIRGQWAPANGQGGLVNNGKRWQDGLTWDMITPDLTTLTKVISKTARSMPEAYEFDLTQMPEVQQRLAVLRDRSAFGPVIVSEKTGLPYTPSGWAQAFRRIRRKLGLPEELKSMDARAGGLTEASTVVSDPKLLRDAGQHKSSTTTDKYLRGRSASANKVIEMRGVKRQ